MIIGLMVTPDERETFICVSSTIPRQWLVNLKKMRRLMKKHGLRCPIRRAIPCHKIKDTMKTYNYAPSFLDREFEYYGPRFVLLTDITHIPWEDHSSTTVEIFKILNFHPFSLVILQS